MRKNMVNISDILAFITTEEFTTNLLHDRIYKVQIYHVVDAVLMMILTVL